MAAKKKTQEISTPRVLDGRSYRALSVRVSLVLPCAGEGSFDDDSIHRKEGNAAGGEVHAEHVEQSIRARAPLADRCGEGQHP